jgi:glycosyltransferase involved in cell wall biosynthesis
MIVRNEEQNLSECLAPVADLFDEIIIVDTGSHDSTKEIAKRFTPHVYEFPWCDDFSAARNESLRHATGDWIFWLDADDRVRPNQVAAIKQVLSQLGDRPQSYFFSTVLLPSAPGGEAVLVSHSRLFRRNPELHWTGRVHEQLGPETVLREYEKQVVDIEIEHVGYLDRAFANHKARLKLRLLRMDYAVDPDNTSTLLHLGMALYALKNHREALRFFLRLFKMDLGSADYMRRVYEMLVELSYMLGNSADAVWYAERGLQEFPDDENLLLARAKIYYLQNDFAATVRTVEHLLGHARPRSFHYHQPANIQSKIAPLLLAGAYRLQRNYSPATALLQAVTRRFPNDYEALFNLGIVFLEQSRWPSFMEVVRQLAEMPEGAANAAMLTAKMLLKHGEWDGARQIINQIIDQAPHLPRARMLRAELSACVQEPLDLQIRAQRDILRIDPGNREARAWLSAAEQNRAPATQPAVALLAAETALGSPAIASSFFVMPFGSTARL